MERVALESDGMNRGLFSSLQNTLWWRFCGAWLLICVAWEIGNYFWSLDIALSRGWGTAEGFALRNHALWGRGLYGFERLLAWGAVLALLVAAALPQGRVRWVDAMPRAQRWWMLGAVLCSALWIQFLKRISASSCPWELAMFGGSVPYVSHWQWALIDGGPGHCFPAGHPSSGFVFFVLAAFAGPYSKRIQAALLGAVTLAGLAMGLTQIARGAHFLSHVLWTGWWCAAAASLAWCLYQIFALRRRP